MDKSVILVNAATGEKHPVGTVAFWKKSGTDCGGRNLTKADVWTCDFSAFTTPGTYRLAIEGIGCSPEFKLSRDIYYEPFKTSVRGFFYMRIGEDKDVIPVPRQPRFIPGVDPVNFKVYLHHLRPPASRLAARSGGDVWDSTDWSKYNEPGNPTNPNAWGGHSDACDWDRHPGHISIIWDMLLPYLLSNGKISDDNLQIRESGNGIPDIIDEARYEVDFWLRLRDGKGGYSRRREQSPARPHHHVPGRRHALHGLGQRRQLRHAGRLLPHRRQDRPDEPLQRRRHRGLEDRQRRGPRLQIRHRQRRHPRPRPEDAGRRLPLQHHRRHLLRRCHGQGERRHHPHRPAR